MLVHELLKIGTMAGCYTLGFAAAGTATHRTTRTRPRTLHHSTVRGVAAHGELDPDEEQVTKRTG